MPHEWLRGAARLAALAALFAEVCLVDERICAEQVQLKDGMEDGSFAAKEFDVEVLECELAIDAPVNLVDAMKHVDVFMLQASGVGYKCRLERNRLGDRPALALVQMPMPAERVAKFPHCPLDAAEPGGFVGRDCTHHLLQSGFRAEQGRVRLLCQVP